MSTLPTASAKPEIVPVVDLLDSVMSGEYRVPKFQRPYVWSPEDMIKLFDSVVRGYPIGSLLIWQTDRGDISSLESIGPIQMTEQGPLLRSYVVDGHQRLATMLGVLRLPENFPRTKMDEWRWWIAYDLRSETFLHLKEDDVHVPLHLLPLRSVLRTVDFARRTRELANTTEFSEDEKDLLLTRADTLQRAIRDYRMPMIVMKSGSLDDAVTIFSRVNQRGRDMTADQMVSALTFREGKDDSFDLAESIDGILGALRATNFGDLERRTVLQVILAIAGMDFTRPSYERIVSRDSYTKMRPAVERAHSAIRRSVDFLVQDVGLRNARLLPYASIVVMLAIYFNGLGESEECPGHIKNLLKKWFWATSFNGWFAGSTTTDLRLASAMMAKLATDPEPNLRRVDRYFCAKPIRPFPEAYDRRSARVRASLLVQIISGAPVTPKGEEINGFDVFASVGSREIPYFFPNQRRPAVSNPANRVILPEGYPRNARAAFLSLSYELEDDIEILKSHFISLPAFEALKNDNFDSFIYHRELSILTGEKKFLEKFDLSFDVTSERNREEIDSDE